MSTALLLVDLQHDYLANPRLHPPADALVARTAQLADACRRHGVPIVHVWTTVDPSDDRRLPHWKDEGRWQCVRGTAGHAAPAPLTAAGRDRIVHKTGFDAFRDGTLEDALASAAIRRVIVAGLHLHACVRSAVAGCLDRGVRVVVADDAVASDDPVHAAATKRWLSARAVGFVSVRALVDEFAGRNGATLAHRSPRDSGLVLFDVQASRTPEIAAVTARSREAWTTWRHTALDCRREILDRFAARMEEAAPVLARRMAEEIGKPIAHAAEEVRRAVANVRDVNRRADHAEVEMPGRPHARALPLGIVALVSPWNNPVAIPAGKIAPALVYGNSVVWKPAPAGTAIAHELLRLLRDSGAPPDVVQVLEGDRTTAQQLAGDDLVDAVTLTGSEAAGYDLHGICSRRSIPLQAELGGNNAAIVWNGADLERAAREIAWGAYGFAGQRCTATRRVVVGHDRFEALWSALSAAASRLVWDDPINPATDVGPVIDAAKRDEHDDQVRRAAGDARVHRLERLFASRAAEPWSKTGAYAQPVLMACDHMAHPLVQEESMAPVLIVQRAMDFEEALADVNAVRHGLAAALFCDDPELQRRFLADARAGILRLNASTAGADVTLPFGGWKASGIGPPEHGVADRMFYTRLQAVYP